MIGSYLLYFTDYFVLERCINLRQLNQNVKYVCLLDYLYFVHLLLKTAKSLKWGQNWKLLSWPGGIYRIDAWKIDFKMGFLLHMWIRLGLLCNLNMIFEFQILLVAYYKEWHSKQKSMKASYFRRKHIQPQHISKNMNVRYSCNKTITTWIQISRQNWNDFFSNVK